MRNTIKISLATILFSLLVILNCRIAFADYQIKVIAGAKSHGCIIRPSSNLLVYLSRSGKGKLLVFKKELNLLSKKIRIAKGAFNSVKNRRDPTSLKLAKKRKKILSNLLLLKKGIQDCRDGRVALGAEINCASSGNIEGLSCDDANPCTKGDRCLNGSCTGTLVGQTNLSCGFGSCTKSISQCLNGKFVACFSGAAGEELCNSLDDDCNGEIDEKGACPINTPQPTSTPISLPTATPTVNPTATPTIPPTNTPINTPTATPSRTPTRTPTPTSTPVNLDPITCAPTSNTLDLNPDGCPCSSNISCVGVCPVLGSGRTVRVCLSGPINHCSIVGNNLNISPDGCACATSADCMGNCVSGACSGGGGPGCPPPGNGFDLAGDGCACDSNLDCIGVCLVSTHTCLS